MPIKKPSNIQEFCETLEKPYSLAKQYFDSTVLEIDFYNDSQFFYDRFSELDEKLQDTVYNNLQRLYDITKETSDNSIEKLKNKLTILTNKTDCYDSIEELLKSTLNIFDKLSDEYVRNYKLSVLNQFLDTADSYKRVSGAMRKVDCSRICNENSEKHNELKDERRKSEKVILIMSVLISVIISVFLSVMFMYICFKVGSEKFLSFFDKHLWGAMISIIITIITILFGTFFKLFKD